MNLSALFIRRPATTTLLTLGAVVFGVMAYLQLPVSDPPAVDFPTIQVQAALPGPYQKVNPGDQPLLFAALRSSTLPLSVVDEYAQQLVAQRISTSKG